MSKPPAISVITPTWDRQILLGSSMDSVLAQRFTDWEHIVVDDGSEDGTQDAVMSRALVDPRVRYIKRAGGPGNACACRNLGWRAARSELIVFLDSDDLLDADSLGRRHSAMTRNLDLDFCVFRTGVFSKVPGDLNRELAQRGQGDDLMQFLFFEIPWQTTGPTWRRSALEKLGGFDEALPSWQDVDLHIRAIAGGLKYLRFPQIDHHMRWHWEDTKVSIMQRQSPKHLHAATDLLVKLERVVREGPGLDWSRQRAICSLYFLNAELWLEAGSVSEALRSWRIAKKRRLASDRLHLSGAALLRLRALGQNAMTDRLINKWKGMMRLRTNPDLVAS